MPLTLTLLATLTITPDGITTASLVMDVDGTEPPPQVALLDQSPEVLAVYVVARLLLNDSTAIIIQAEKIMCERVFMLLLLLVY